MPQVTSYLKPSSIYKPGDIFMCDEGRYYQLSEFIEREGGNIKYVATCLDDGVCFGYPSKTIAPAIKGLKFISSSENTKITIEQS